VPLRRHAQIQSRALLKVADHAEQVLRLRIAARAEQQDQAFFNCWTRKVAYIKVIGEGLTDPLNRFVVTLIPGEVGRLVYVDGSPAFEYLWLMVALYASPGYTAAVAVEGGWERLR
jgi:4'-phosphopantetheinyl transferase